jgi:hypothetical protein
MHHGNARPTGRQKKLYSPHTAQHARLARRDAPLFKKFTRQQKSGFIGKIDRQLSRRRKAIHRQFNRQRIYFGTN